jgi:nitrate/nitrite-specific signal transduction histidine kinase
MNDKRAPEASRAPLAQEVFEAGAFRPLARGGEAVQHLRQALERVGRESASLVKVAASLEEFVRSQEGRYAELEQELNDTALLYVASYQLQARGDPKEVLRHVRELLEQLVGVDGFVLYLGAPDGRAVAVAARGLADDQLTPRRTTDAPLAEVFARKAPVVLELSPLPKGSLEQPLAVVPLKLGERIIGAIVVTSLFAHKTSWAPVDHQLFYLLSSHAASALLAAYLLQRQSDLLATLAGLGESLR